MEYNFEDFPIKFYEVGDSLGSGSFGMVKKYTKRERKWHEKARKPEPKGLPEAVAVKSFTDPKSMDRTWRELQVAKKCDHPNIVKAFGICKDSVKNDCLVLELCETDLANHLKERGGKLSIATCTKIASQLSSGLQYLKSKDIVHRNMKPANILFRSVADTAVVIADFGILDVSSTFSRVGPRAYYMAPEVLNFLEKLIGHPCDTFALGLICLEMATGVLIAMVSMYSEFIKGT